MLAPVSALTGEANEWRVGFGPRVSRVEGRLSFLRCHGFRGEMKGTRPTRRSPQFWRDQSRSSQVTPNNSIKAHYVDEQPGQNGQGGQEIRELFPANCPALAQGKRGNPWPAHQLGREVNLTVLHSTLPSLHTSRVLSSVCCSFACRIFDNNHQANFAFGFPDLLKTSSPRSSAPPSAAAAQDGIGGSPTRDVDPPKSPAFSTSSTFDGSEDEASSSLVLPSLPAPQLSGRAREHLRRIESPQSHSEGEDNNSQYVTASWGSPYPPSSESHLRRQSFSSEPSDDSPIHQLEISTPFLRRIPPDSPTNQAQTQQSGLSDSAAVLLNRARRPVRSITEDWIRAHTTNDLTSEHRHWLSDGDYSEHSSLSGSISGDDAAWFEEADPRTPRASRTSRASSRYLQEPRQASRHHPRLRASNETLKQSTLKSDPNTMDTLSLDTGRGAQDAVSIHTLDSASDLAGKIETPRVEHQPSMNGSIHLPATPTKPTKPVPTQTPRLKKKVPWKGKNIMVHLPRDDQRGQPGMGPIPMSASQMADMLRSWDELGYNTRGFDLEGPVDRASLDPLENYSQSRNQWPSPEQIVGERAQRSYAVLLPDLNAWKDYVNELQEAKLRALGVSFGDEEPAPAPSTSPAPSALSRRMSMQYPSLPFSPPIPTGSATSGGQQGFPFPGAFHGTSATQSPTVPSVASPLSFHGMPGKFNPRASISISPNELPFHFSGHPSPHGFSPRDMLLQQQLGRSGSPSLMNFNSLMSPTSPFQHEGAPSPLGMHQRHQSLQYPMLPHQQLHRQDSARASPRLQDLREDEEEVQSNPYEEDKSPSKTPEPAQFIKHNASASLQREIDDAEYHLEEQFREQLEHEDYSPHQETGKADGYSSVDPAQVPLPAHDRGPSVHFTNFGNDSDEGPVLHHPRPHSRGHSLTQKPFFDNDEARDSTDDASAGKLQTVDEQKGDESYEIQTNPSNLGTPVSAFGLVSDFHQRSISTTSNPWADVQSFNGDKPSSRRPSHTSKPSFSKLNAGATEFKFNPTSNFTPGKFNFGASSFQPAASSFQPAAFQASTFMSNAPQSATSSHFSAPSTSSSKGKINAAAPAFSPRQSEFQFPGKSEFSLPGKSDFSFSASVPKFRPDAPAFQPSIFSASVTSAAASGNESADNRRGSIFGSIDLKLSSDVVPPAKKSKAIPIVRPVSSHKSPTPGPDPAPIEETDQYGRPTDASRRSKKFRDDMDDGDDVPRFAEPTPEPEPLMVQQSKALAKSEIPVEDKQGEEEEDNEAVGDTTLDSTVLSESTDAKLHSESHGTKATTSPSATSPEQEQANWAPFEFRNDSEVQDFNNARPFGDFDSFQNGHKKSLSANAKAFVPNFTFGGPNPMAATFEPSFKSQPAPMVEPQESEDDRGASPTPGPEPRTVAGLEKSAIQPQREPTPEPVRAVQPAKSGLATSRFATAAPRQGLGASRFASPPPEPKGLSASRLAKSPSPVSDEDETPEKEHAALEEPSELHSFNESIPIPVSPPSISSQEVAEHANHGDRELTFEEIDAVMQHMNEIDPTMGVNRTVDSPTWHQPSPTRNATLSALPNASPLHLPPKSQFRSDGPSPSPQQHRPLPPEPAPPMLSTEFEDPFLDPPRSVVSHTFDVDGPVHNLGSGNVTESEEWDKAFSADEQDKLEQRVQYFNGHVQDLVGDMLADRLDPLEKTLGTIQHALLAMSRRTPSSRPERRSVSAEIQESDADDEDDDFPVRKSISPQRNRKMEQIRFAVMEALNHHHASRALQTVMEQSEPQATIDNTSVLRELQEMREQFSQSLHLDFRADDLRNVVEEAVQSRLPPTPPPVVKDDDEATRKMAEMQVRIHELEQRLMDRDERVENETLMRRAAEDRSAELKRQLDQAETKIEVEIMNRSVYDQRVHDLEERLRHQEEKTDFELHGRREAEDRLSEIQRLLRISSEEEDRLRAVLEERDQKMKSIEHGAGKNAMRLALLEAAQSNADKTQIDLTNRLNATDEELRSARQETRHWRSEAEHARDSSRRQTDDLVTAIDEAKHLRKVIDTLNTQLGETEKIRETWRVKFVSMQDDMAHAAREITEENSRRLKKEQALIARQEVLDARLQAESKTRERLEAELERLEGGERAGMRAVAECKRLEALLTELRNENHKIQTTALHFQREAKEARESAATEVQRTRTSVQADLDAANEQVNVVRVELEAQINQVQTELAQALLTNESLEQQHEVALEDELAKFRAQVDQVKMDAETSKAHYDMMLEEAQTTGASNLEELSRKQQSDIEDLQTRYERELSNKTEDAQRTESNLLERLSLSSSKVEHLQDRVAHLEEKVQIAQEAAKAAAQAAKAAGSSEPAVAHAATIAKPQAVAQAMQLPEKISPQALRESIMVLQEQLQAREQRIEELEQTVARLDPDAAIKITKLNDEITWLRELLAVRHSDLQDLIVALSADHLDREAVKDATIRLKANLQMEEQERERALNGGSAINLPDIAAAIKGAATPRVAQAVGPLAAAWGNWRKGNQPSLNNISSMLSSPATARNQTPSRSNPSPASQNSFLSGLMTPPASGLRNTPPAEQSKPQPTAFGNTGRRYTAEQFANRTRGPSLTARQAEKMPMPGTPPRRIPEQQEPVTPPMARSSGYDADASHIEDFDDAGFFDD
ncbi:myosin class II heavy chain [Seiridium cupressi]